MAVPPLPLALKKQNSHQTHSLIITFLCDTLRLVMAETLSSPEQAQIRPEMLSQKPDYGIFLSGGLGTHKGVKSIDTAMQHVFGGENVTVYNSALNFADAPDPAKFQAIANSIADTIDDGRRAHVVAHSLGASELYMAFKEMEKQRPDAYQNLNGEHITLTLIAPSGFIEGTRDAFSYLGRTIRFARLQSNMPGHILENELRGIDSINVLPPHAISSEILTEGLRAAMPDLSQYEEGFADVAFLPDRDYSAHIPQDVRELVGYLDEELQAAIEQRNANAVREVLSERGAVLLPYTAKTYEGDYFEEPDTQPQEPFSWSVPAAIALTRMLSEMFRGKPVDEVRRLEKNGVRVNFIVPEYDIFMPFDEVMRYFDEGEVDPSNRVVFASLSAHAFPALQPNNFENALQTIRGKE